MARETALQTALRSSSKERKEEPGYVGDFAGEKKCTQRSKDYCHSKKNQTSKVNDFSPFLCIRRCKSLGLLK